MPAEYERFSPIQSSGIPDAAAGIQGKIVAAEGLGRTFLQMSRGLRQSPIRRGTCLEHLWLLLRHMSGRVSEIQLNAESTCRLPIQCCGMPDASEGAQCKMAAAKGLGRASLATERGVRQSPRRRWTWVLSLLTDTSGRVWEIQPKSKTHL